MYGLQSAPALYCELLSKFLTEDLPFKRSRSDTTLYSHYDEATPKWLIVTAFVDDLLIVGDDLDLKRRLKAAMLQRFGKDLTWSESVSSFLGLHCKQNASRTEFRLSAASKIDDMFKRFNFGQVHGARAPWDSSFNNLKAEAHKPLTGRQRVIQSNFPTFVAFSFISQLAFDLISRQFSIEPVVACTLLSDITLSGWIVQSAISMFTDTKVLFTASRKDLFVTKSSNH